jgi:hypothetical protein
MFYGGAVFMTGWILRAVSAHHPSNLGLFIAQTIFIYAGPPIYAAAEYNTLGRLMHYLPMHAPLNPDRVLYFFIYLGALVESLTGAGAGKLASSKPGSDQYKSGGTLIAVATVLQAGVECVFISMVALLHYRCSKAGMLSKNVKIICVTLYGTSFLIIARCVFRAVEAFTEYTQSCGGFGIYCGSVARHEWYLYAFEAASKKRYLDVDGKTERMGPGWIDERPLWKTFVDPFSLQRRSRNNGEQTKFWLRPNQWSSSEDRSFALGTASNHGANRDIESK